MSNGDRFQHWYLGAKVELLRRLAYRRARALTLLDPSHARLEGGKSFPLAATWPVEAQAQNVILKPVENLVWRRRVPVTGLAHGAVERTVALNFTTWTGIKADEACWAAEAEAGDNGQIRAIVIAIYDAREVERLREMGRQNGCQCEYIDLGVGPPLSLRARSPAWSGRELAAAMLASSIWFAASVNAWLASRTAMQQVQTRLDSARVHLAEQARLQTRLSAIERELTEQDARSRRLFSRALADASTAFAAHARLDELSWDQGTLSLRLVTADPDQLASSGRAIADEAGLQQVGGLTAASDRSGEGFRVSLRYRARQ